MADNQRDSSVASKRWLRRYWLPVSILLVGLLVPAGITALWLHGENRSAVRVVLPGRHRIHLKAGTYKVFYEHRAVVDGRIFDTPKTFPRVTCNIAVDGGGQAIQLNPCQTRANYVNGVAEGVSVFDCEIPADGWYWMTCEDPPNRDWSRFVLAFWRDFTSRFLIVIGLLFGSVMLSWGTAIGIAIVIYRKVG